LNACTPPTIVQPRSLEKKKKGKRLRKRWGVLHIIKNFAKGVQDGDAPQGKRQPVSGAHGIRNIRKELRKESIGKLEKE